MKILVTGSNGRIGANLVKRLLEKGHQIRGFIYPGDASRLDKLDKFDQIEIIEGDLRNFNEVEQAVQGVDAIYHLAAAFASPHNNVEYLQVNGIGTLHLLEAIRRKVPHLHRFVYACTEAIYWKLEEKGRLFENPISEEMVSKTHAMPYFLTKWIGEELCMNYFVQYGIPVVVCRFATVFEPSEFLNEEGIPKFCALETSLNRYRAIKNLSKDKRDILLHLMRAASDGKKLLISRCPDGRSFKQEWADVRDIALGLELSLEQEKIVGEAFTLGGLLTVWEEDVPELAKRLGIQYAEAKMSEPNYFEFDRTKTKNLLKYEAQHDLWSTLNTALAMRNGRETDVIPTGIRYG